ncbi:MULTISPECIES: putative quinol monooxygenase [unclassified Polaribacter]|uniref:putative quinol monooxygenase n=1 Tax=unclassified Polaribacter TaxID=196858 RepID=UPI0011BD5E78|nr:MULTISPECIES: antibiotic biosynthesis monooxygenase family protein [unclassified Polaribacter]TXD53023.1 antibiotic biosynthesis monooxygenase [Polaribacter sp. IC063]TXD59476.1 antibiotic biosynthesis monooxygenase [Polaribacter sp. IC066]
MFVRIVKMSFHSKYIKEFQAMFEEKKQLIRNSDGCQLLELYQDKNNPELFFTYSYWENESDLENYRNSDFFKETWKQTKTYFNEKPEAWSVDKKESLT